MTQLRVYVEGSTDVPVARKVAQLAGFDPANPVVLGGASGVDALLSRLLGSASAGSPVFVLRDVDPTPPNLKGRRFVQCGSTVLRRLGVPNRAKGFCLRLARHEMESWLLADARSFSRWLGCPEQAVPSRPDELTKPALEIFELARHPKAKPLLRDALVPGPQASSKYGAGFEAAISRFAAGPWNPRRARTRSRSLDHCLRALERMVREV